MTLIEGGEEQKGLRLSKLEWEEVGWNFRNDKLATTGMCEDVRD